MIESFHHKGLRQFFEEGDRSKLRPDQVRRIAIVLAALDDAQTVKDLDRPGFKLHPLKGELAGFWSIWVNGNWRVVFRFEGGTALKVNLIDYH